LASSRELRGLAGRSVVSPGCAQARRWVSALQALQLPAKTVYAVDVDSKKIVAVVAYVDKWDTARTAVVLLGEAEEPLAKSMSGWPVLEIMDGAAKE
jgi:predicted RNA methylase